MKKRIFYAVVAILIVLWIGYSLWLRQGRSLSTELIPTAEALIQNPLPRPAFVAINPPPGGNLVQGQKMCLSLEGNALLKKGQKFKEFRDFLAFNTILYINNRPLFNIASFPAMPAGPSEGPESGIAYFCYTPDLEKGIHIAEVTTKTTSGTELYYKWAFTVQ